MAGVGARNSKGQFVKGSTPNPGGRPKTVAAIRDLAQMRAPEAFERVLELTKSTDERVALAACQEVLNRAYGKPMQAHEVDCDFGGLKIVVEHA